MIYNGLDIVVHELRPAIYTTTTTTCRGPIAPVVLCVSLHFINEAPTFLHFLNRPHLFGLTDNAGHEIAGHENAGQEFARHDKYRMKRDYITLECAFLLNFKSFVCYASVLTYKKT